MQRRRVRAVSARLEDVQKVLPDNWNQANWNRWRRDGWEKNVGRSSAGHPGFGASTDSGLPIGST
jgi:hypothetical protein